MTKKKKNTTEKAQFHDKQKKTTLIKRKTETILFEYKGKLNRKKNKSVLFGLNHSYLNAFITAKQMLQKKGYGECT